MANVEADAPRTLPIFRAVAEAHGSVWRRRVALAKVTWVWLLVVTASCILVSWVEGVELTFGEQAPADGRRPNPSPYDVAVNIADRLVCFLACCAVGFGWHRAILPRDEQAATADFGPRRRFLYYFGAAALYFTLCRLALYILLVFTVLLFQLGASFDISVTWKLLNAFPLFLGVFVPGLILFSALSLRMIYIMARRILVFPALAVRVGPVSMRDIWHKTRGNGWRLLGGLVSCALPIMLIGIVVLAAFWVNFDNRLSTEFVVVALRLIGALFVFGAIVISAGFVSIAYRELMLPEDSNA